MTRIETHVVLSTAHLTAETSEALTEMGADTADHREFGDWRNRVTVCEYGYGHWVRVASADPSDPDDDFEARVACMPDDLAGCMRHASLFGAGWILFDRDEPEIGDLPVHEW